ncbi:LLM class flavin-dependent oxidoreductase [Brachybacterium saurashtrense]|uniref:LLM class flavin-dependent oxidoreductase n=1 Tax=Brachybacterium saurashtrense TaxID=556288 RepID=A0A345YN41_9MICO|nr:LLM class flavin-dependent oxidoreductase [Brachybacterium saurashtrense]AXK45343.1 LLM class flavin-dependent oxidoreductase [Brachybacterium saurashtrense]RRR21900.1 LLM class flavin-dependent oxidoreductase [Brachybacterium saurashtrense]
MSIDPQAVTFGLDTFGDVTVDDEGAPVAPAQVLRDVVAQGELADRVGIDHFSIGEHHRPDFAVSAPDIVLAALTSRTERITLGTAVIVLSSDDPLRVIERFSTLDALSQGRAELTVGRGSFTESFALFGVALEDYETLFEEKLDLLVAGLSREPITWSGTTRPPLRNQSLHPALDRELPTWVAVGGSPHSVLRAARHGLPLMLAIIGGPSQRFAPFVDLFREATQELGVGALPVGVHSPGHIAADDETARRQLAPHWIHNRNEIGRERGWGPSGLAEFEAEADHGALYVGSPETVAQKIAATITALGIERFDMKYASGPMPHAQLMESIRLYGTEVIPRVRELLAG